LGLGASSGPSRLSGSDQSHGCESIGEHRQEENHAVNATNTITGSLLSRSPTFPTGAVNPGNVNLGGVLLARSPTFPTGSLNVPGDTLTGILLTRSPTFPIGILIFTHPGAGLSRGTGPVVASRGTGRRPVMAGSSRPW